MHRFYIYLTAFISITTMPVLAFAEIAAEAVTPDTQNRNGTHTINTDGLYLDIPSVNYNQLIKQIRTSHARLTQRKHEKTRYLDENQLNSKDTLIAVIMPGGLLYAAARKNNLDKAQSELSEITEAMAELSYDLLTIQAKVNTLTVAQLQ